MNWNAPHFIQHLQIFSVWGEEERGKGKTKSLHGCFECLRRFVN
jgi:hypothetical protein